MTGLVDQYGRPIRREALTREVATPTIGGVRSPLGGYPGDGLNPVRLANILREADAGDPLRYYELAEQIEERDPHYLAVLSTRKRSVAQIDITVDAASDDAADVDLADMVRDWLTRDELADEVFDMLDAIGKGESFTEIVWDTSAGQWRPDRLEWRDPRWFVPDRTDLRTPMLRGGEDGSGVDTPLEPFKFIHHIAKAKSGLPVRSGLARLAAWGWMFKAFTLRDWAIFTQTYGQPVRVGKFHSGASDEDKKTLFRAVANIAGDCAAIIPAEMEIEFISAENIGSGAGLYEKRADWLDRQMSKAVLGQTTTTDAISGGHAVSREHRQVQEDIETADCKALAATLNRDLVRPWVDLDRGPQKRYPRLRIARPKQEDLTGLADSLAKLVPIGLRVQQSEIRDKFGLSDPDEGAELLAAPAPAPEAARVSSGVALQRRESEAPAAAPTPADAIGDRLVEETRGDMGALLGQIEAMMAAAADLGEFGEMLRAAYPDLDTSAIAGKIALGMTAAHAAGRAGVVDDRA
ncbi:DUF935 domain-containing protein [Hephaestia caeni]|nr:DUF935 domain-containing protein [Hephaestia caeni]